MCHDAIVQYPTGCPIRRCVPTKGRVRPVSPAGVASSFCVSGNGAIQTAHDALYDRWSFRMRVAKVDSAGARLRTQIGSTPSRRLRIVRVFGRRPSRRRKSADRVSHLAKEGAGFSSFGAVGSKSRVGRIQVLFICLGYVRKVNGRVRIVGGVSVRFRQGVNQFLW